MGCTTDTSDTTGPDTTPTPSTTSTVTTQAPTITATTTTTTMPSTTTTAPSTTTTTTTVPERHSEIVLSADGLGVVSFEEPMDDVLTILIDLFGPPTSDEVVEPAFSNGEEVSFGYFRGVRWWGPSVRLYVEFVDWSLNWDPLATPVFSYWAAGQGEIPLRTVEGVGPGTPWSEAAEVYGDRVETQQDAEDCGGRWNFVTDGGTGNPFYTTLHGMLDGDPTNPSTSVTWMAVGREAFPQGC